METETNGAGMKLWLRLLHEPNHDPAYKFPPYLVLVSGEKGKDGCGDRFFSKQLGLESIEEIMDTCEVDTELVMMIHDEIEKSDLPEKLTQADRFFRREDVRDNDDCTFARLIGAVPGEEGSGRARYEVRKWAPNWSRNTGELFVNGMAVAASNGHFSKERALEQIGTAFANGLLSESERETVAAEACALGLPEKMCQLDRIVQTKDVQYLGFLLGNVPAERGSGHASIKLCSISAGDVHAHVTIPGRCPGVRRKAFYSTTSAMAWIEKLHGQGYYSDEEFASLKQELQSLGLPVTHTLDSADVVELADPSLHRIIF